MGGCMRGTRKSVWSVERAVPVCLSTGPSLPRGWKGTSVALGPTLGPSLGTVGRWERQFLLPFYIMTDILWYFLFTLFFKPHLLPTTQLVLNAKITNRHKLLLYNPTETWLVFFFFPFCSFIVDLMTQCPYSSSLKHFLW